MMAIDGNVPQGAGGWLPLGGIVLATAVAATTIAIGFGRCVIALTRGITIVFERELRIAPGQQTRRMSTAATAWCLHFGFLFWPRVAACVLLR